MATARKLPSGSWRARAYLGKDENGKDITVSFTAPTKREAEKRAATYALENHRSSKSFGVTVKDIIDRYITAKTPVLSPSTIRGYRGLQKACYGPINNMRVAAITNEDLQLFVSSMVGKLGPKYISNIYGLLSAALAMFRPDAVFRVTLPSKKRKRASSPSDAEVSALFNAATSELKLCIALAAFGSLRRGEICALKHSDVSGRMVHVHADMVMDENRVYVYKDFPKTSESVRSVLLPDEVISLIGDGVDDEYIVGINPSALTHRFTRLRERMNMPGIRFHDLRHYFASIGAVLGIPDSYLSEFGGWRTDSGVMKQVYQNTISNVSRQYAETMNDHFSSLIAASEVIS